MSEDTLAGKVLDGWAIHGVAVIQSGQPYSIIDYSGAVGSILLQHVQWHHQPDRAAGSRMQPQERAHRPEWRLLQSDDQRPGAAALKASCFTLPFIPAGTMGVPNGDTLKPTSSPASATSSASPGSGAPMLRLVKDLPIHEPFTSALHLRRLQPHQHHRASTFRRTT